MTGKRCLNSTKLGVVAFEGDPLMSDHYYKIPELRTANVGAGKQASKEGSWIDRFGVHIFL